MSHDRQQHKQCLGMAEEGGEGGRGGGREGGRWGDSIV